MLNICISYDMVIPLLGIYVHYGIFIRIIRAALFIVANKMETFMHQDTVVMSGKTSWYYLYTDYHLPTKKNGILIHSTNMVKLEHTRLS